MKNIVKFSCVVVLGFAATACGSDTKTSSTTAASTTAVAVPTTSAGTPATSAAPTTTVAASTVPTSGSTDSSGAASAAGVQLVDSSLGKILADADGNTLYMFAKDTATTSACTDACATKWPALAGPVEPGTGLDAEDFATITGAGGTQQATFYAHPLYHFSGDTKPGNTNGQGVGGVWYVMDGEGNAVGADATSTTVAATGSTTAASSEAGAASAAGVQLVDSGLGKILADADGNTLYMFAKDTATTSACTDACAKAWPALAGPVEPGAGLDDEDFATIAGADGAQQATFYGHPLYHFAGDAKPGDTTGQGVGGVWYVIDDEGDAVGADATSTTAAGAAGVAEVTTTTADSTGY